MPPWVAATMIAILVATVPMAWVLRIMRDLPDPVLSSHRRWPAWANSILIAVVTACVAVFVRITYYGPPRGPAEIGLQMLIACVIYVFGMVLLVRQFAGLYPEYFVTAGRSGLAVRKAVYRNIAAVETIRETPTETLLRIEMISGEFLLLELPTTQVALLFDLIRDNKPEP